MGLDERLIYGSSFGAAAATARVVTDAGERQPLIQVAAQRWGHTDLPAMLQHSPLVVLKLDGDAPDRRVDA